MVSASSWTSRSSWKRTLDARLRCINSATVCRVGLVWSGQNVSVTIKDASQREKPDRQPDGLHFDILKSSRHTMLFSLTHALEKWAYRNTRAAEVTLANFTHPFSTTSCTQGRGELLEPLPAVFEWRQPDESAIYGGARLKKTNKHKFTICMHGFWTVGGSRGTQREPTQAQGEHGNSTHTSAAGTESVQGLTATLVGQTISR